jgi:hypothetical protein
MAGFQLCQRPVTVSYDQTLRMLAEIAEKTVVMAELVGISGRDIKFQPTERGTLIVCGPPEVELKAVLTAGVKVPLVAVRVYPLPTRSMLSPLKVATPLTALTVVVPDSIAPVAPVPAVMARVTAAVEATVVLVASWIATTGWVVKTPPGDAPAG